MKYYKSKTAKFLAGKGFYPIVALCLAAIGVASWSAVSSLKTESPKTDSPSYTAPLSSYNDTVESEEPTAHAVSDVEDTRPSSKAQASSEPQKAVKPIAEYFIMPIEGKIAKGYSADKLQYSATYSDMRIHNGIDIEAEKGSTVNCAGDGTVLSVEQDALWGSVIKIDHGNNKIAIYCGIDEIKVKANDTVTAGKPLGVLGTQPCEANDNPHLHLAFESNGKYISPLEAMGLKG